MSCRKDRSSKHYQAGDIRDVYFYHVNRWDTHKKNIVDCLLRTVAEFLNTLRKI